MGLVDDVNKNFAETNRFMQANTEKRPDGVFVDGPDIEPAIFHITRSIGQSIIDIAAALERIELRLDAIEAATRPEDH